MNGRLLFLSLALVSLAACTSTGSRGPRYYQDDGPHAKPPANLNSIPDAVPRAEPLSLSGNNPYVVFGKKYTPMKSAKGYRSKGVASWYGKKFHGKRTSNGESYDMYAMTAAHKTLPLPSYVRVRNLDNNRSVVVRVNDRGPFLHKRLIDLSYAAAHRLGVIGTGTARVEVTAIPTGQRPAQGVAVAGHKEEPVIESEPLPASTHTGEGMVFIQAGSFGNRDNAIALRDQLKSANIRPVNIATAMVNRDRFFRVRVGPLANMGIANSLSQRLRNLGIQGARIIVE